MYPASLEGKWHKICDYYEVKCGTLEVSAKSLKRQKTGGTLKRCLQSTRKTLKVFEGTILQILPLRRLPWASHHPHAVINVKPSRAKWLPALVSAASVETGKILPLLHQPFFSFWEGQAPGF